MKAKPGPILLAAVVLCLVMALAYFATVCHSIRTEKERIRERYSQMIAALARGDKKLVQTYYTSDSASMLNGIFTKPLDGKSAIRLRKDQAQVTPRRIFHYGVIPGGHSIEMVKVS